jgi:phytol kinase
MTIPDWLVFFVTLLLAVIWLAGCGIAVKRKWITPALNRKVIHISTGPLFLLTWPFFENTPTTPFIVALLPACVTGMVLLTGARDTPITITLFEYSRPQKKSSEIAAPLTYGLAFTIATTLFWTRSPAGVAALMILCGGDGMAEILGKRFGKRRLPWSTHKTWAGSLGMLLGGFLLALGIINYFVLVGIFSAPLAEYLYPLAFLAIIGTIVESLPLPGPDNLYIPLATGLAGWFWWG